MTPRIALVTLALNEIRWLDSLYRQQKDWPGLVSWVFVEAADRAYASANPDAVTEAGLSVDGTTEWLAQCPGIDYQPVGFVGDGGAQGKIEARNRYMERLGDVRPDWVIVVDADEGYCREDQARISEMLAGLHRKPCGSLLLRQRHIWRPASIADRPLMDLEVVGAYFAIPHLRVWRWRSELRHRSSHNWLEMPGGVSHRADVIRAMAPTDPECVHLGFAASLTDRQRKSAYYVNRGEGAKDGRSMYVECRAAWERWAPGDTLPHGARVVPYSGPVPECFR